MILDVARHKFHESLITLIIIAIIAVVRGAMLTADVPAAETPFATAPLQPAIDSFAASHTIIAALLSLVLIMHSSLRLARATVRDSLYASRTMAAISLTAIILAGFAICSHSLQTLIVASLLAEMLARTFHYMTHSSRLHYLFTAMLALGTLPLVDSSLLAMLIVLPILLIFIRAQLRDILVGITGAALPIFTYCYIMWCCGESFGSTATALWDNMFIQSSFELGDYLSLSRLVLGGVVLFVQLCALLLHRKEAMSLTLATRNIWNMLYLVLLVLIAVFVLLPSTSAASIVAVLMISATALPLFFLRMDTVVAVITYIVLVIFSIVAI